MLEYAKNCICVLITDNYGKLSNLRCNEYSFEFVLKIYNAVNFCFLTYAKKISFIPSGYKVDFDALRDAYAIVALGVHWIMICLFPDVFVI